MNLPKKLNNKFLQAAGIFLLAAVLAFGIYFYRTKDYESWLPADGVVTNIEKYSDSGRKPGNKRSHRIYFAFMVDDKTYYGATLYSGWDTDVAVGDYATVWYDPEDPSDLSNSSFHKPHAKLDFIVVFIMAAPLIAVVLLRNTNSNSQSPLNNR